MPLFGQPTTNDDPRATSVRRCGKCKADAVTCVHVTVHYTNGLPMGRTYQHRCQKCSRTFSTISAWRTITEGFFALFCAPFGFFSLMLLARVVMESRFSTTTGGEWGMIAIFLLMGAFGAYLGGSTLVRTWRLFENPVVAARPPGAPAAPPR
jgi:hypothetical protein